MIGAALEALAVVLGTMAVGMAPAVVAVYAANRRDES